MAALLGLEAEIKALNEAVAALESEAVVELKSASIDAFKTMLGNTPVWSGESVANYHAGTSRGEGYVSPSGTQPPRQATNSLPLGAEENRGPNEAIAEGSLSRGIESLGNRLGNLEIYSTLSAEKADLIDNGSAPTPGTARNKGGVTKLAEQTVRSRSVWK